MGNQENKQEVWMKMSSLSDNEVEISSLTKMFTFFLPSEVMHIVDTLFHRMVEQAGNTQEVVPEISDISMVIRHMKEAFKEVKVRDKRGNPIH